MGTLWFNILLAAGLRVVLPITKDGSTLAAAACNLSSVSEDTEEMPAATGTANHSLVWQSLLVQALSFTNHRNITQPVVQ